MGRFRKGCRKLAGLSKVDCINCINVYMDYNTKISMIWLSNDESEIL